MKDFLSLISRFSIPDENTFTLFIHVVKNVPNNNIIHCSTAPLYSGGLLLLLTIQHITPIRKRLCLPKWMDPSLSGFDPHPHKKLFSTTNLVFRLAGTFPLSLMFFLSLVSAFLFLRDVLLSSSGDHSSVQEGL